MSEDHRASFEKLIGQTIGMSSPILGNDPIKLHEVILRGVEGGGIWIESPNVTQGFLQKNKIQATPKTPVFFVPYQQIYAVLSSIDRVSLSDSAFDMPE
jgi:hypothetical protein